MLVNAWHDMLPEGSGSAKKHRRTQHKAEEMPPDFLPSFDACGTDERLNSEM